MSNKGKTVKVHYRGTLTDGTQFDCSYDRNQPLEFVCGGGQMIAGFDAAVEDMIIGQKKTVEIPAAQAYGEHNEEAVQHISVEYVADAANLPVGERVYFNTEMGPMPALIVSVDEKEVVLDLNHELAGKDLIFEIELLDVQ